MVHDRCRRCRAPLGFAARRRRLCRDCWAGLLILFGPHALVLVVGLILLAVL